MMSPKDNERILAETTARYAPGGAYDLEYNLAHAIFKAQQAFEQDEGNEPLPDRHFKVAVVLYLAMANGALDHLRGTNGTSEMESSAARPLGARTDDAMCRPAFATTSRGVGALASGDRDGPR